MISAEIKVNTSLVGYVYARNTNTEKGGKHVYTCEYYQPELGKVITFEIQHKREDGFVKLMELLFHKIGELKK
jgi:hypothetical protein